MSNDFKEALQEIAALISQYQDESTPADTKEVNKVLTKIAQRVNLSGDFGAPDNVDREISC